ncbi:MAG TPA: alkaline phosphatase family protein [Euzebyales bacterium]|nr:alkaline phosphatase family protein [Euzebyales bacterium]
MAAYLFERYRPTLLLVHVEGVVQIQQEPDWRNPRRVRAIACADLVVSLLVELIERTDAWPHTTLIVTGDSGMAEVHTQVRPNAWLIDAGLRPRVLDGSGDWRATFHAIGGCAFLRVQPPADENAAAARQVLARVRGAREMFRIVDRAELDALGSDPEAPFALAAAPGYVIDRRAEGPSEQQHGQAPHSSAAHSSPLRHEKSHAHPWALPSETHATRQAQAVPRWRRLCSEHIDQRWRGPPCVCAHPSSRLPSSSSSRQSR